MKVVKSDSVIGKEHCNFCDKGVLGDSIYGLRYPYKYVYSFKRETGGLLANICEECLQELHTKAKLLNDKA